MLINEISFKNGDSEFRDLHISSSVGWILVENENIVFLQMQECGIKPAALTAQCHHSKMYSWFKHEKVKWPFKGLALKTSLVWKGSQTSFSMFPPARKMMVTSPISTQEKMKLMPTPLWRTETIRPNESSD